jgi:hypothetical protein
LRPAINGAPLTVFPGAVARNRDVNAEHGSTVKVEPPSLGK